MKTAFLSEKIEDNNVRCLACAHRCVVPEGRTGICGVRQTMGRELELLVYGKAVAVGVDPIEKKPLFHFLPGSRAFSIGTFGCNMRCANCQNFDISQIMGLKGRTEKYGSVDWGQDLSPEEAVASAKEADCASIAYTYNEPTIWAEYALAIMKPAQEADLKNVWVSNGFMTGETLEAVAPYLDAINVDIKSMDDDFYKKNCGASLEPVLETCRRVKKRGIHLEVTTLVIPTLSDDEEMLKRLAKFIKGELGADTPWHVSAFSGAISWKLKELPDTDPAKLKRVRQMGRDAGLNYVFVGNVPEPGLEDTVCPECGTTAIARLGYGVDDRLEEGKCPRCGLKIL